MTVITLASQMYRKWIFIQFLSTTISIVFLTPSAVSTLSQVTIDFTVVEECTIGTLVGNLNNRLLSHSIPFISDPSLKSSGRTNFQLLTPSKLFFLNETSGDIIVASRVDRESICSTIGNDQQQSSSSSSSKSRQRKSLTDSQLINKACQVQLQILHFFYELASDVEHRVLAIRLTILDINDNSPQWHENVLKLSIAEHSPIGTRIPLPTAFDPDCGPTNTTVSYLLASNNGDRGLVNDDFTDHFQLDTEDDGPMLAGSDQSGGSLLWSNSLASPSSFMCSRRRFRLWLRIMRDFEYDTDNLSDRRDSGLLGGSVNARSIQLKLLAMDGGIYRPLTGSVLINIAITDINDHEPVFDIAPLTDRLGSNQLMYDASIEVPEDRPVKQVIYTAKALDADETDADKLRFSLTSSASSLDKQLFNVDAKTGQVSLLRQLDYEKQTSHLLPISVTDGQHVAGMTLNIKVLNVNDHPPVINVRPVGSHPPSHSTSPTYRPTDFGGSSVTQPGSTPIPLSIVEHEPPGRFIATVTVTDIDDTQLTESTLSSAQLNFQPSTDIGPGFGHNRQGTFHCQVSHAGLTLQPLYQGSINQFQLKTQVSFDREQQVEHWATLVCYDRGQPPASSQVTLRLVVRDINDNPPVFKTRKMIAHLDENSPIGSEVYRVLAYDLDEGRNAQLAFQLDQRDMTYSTINRTSGVVSNLIEFDRELQAEFNLTVIVRDRAADNVLSDSIIDSSEQEHRVEGQLRVIVDDLNDCPPLFPSALYQFKISEDAQVNALVGSVHANDSDATEANNQIHYSIKPENDNHALHDFRVSPKGNIYAARGNLDREKVPHYNFNILAIDSGKPPLTSSAEVHVHVLDVNDNAPVWTFPLHNNHVFNLTIDEPMGFQVGQLEALDADEGLNGLVNYRIVQSSALTRSPSIGDDVRHRQKVNNKDIVSNSTHHRPSAEQHVPTSGGNLFDIVQTSGALYVGRTLMPSDVGTIKLVIEAFDQGEPPKVNHRVIQMNIDRYQHGRFGSSRGWGEGFKNNQGSYQASTQSNSVGGQYIENDLIIIVIMVAVTLVISMALIVAILFLRCGICSSHRPADSRAATNQLHHHHSEEVFRDSVDPDGSLARTLSHELNSPTPLEQGQMLKSFLTNHSNDPWHVSTMDPTKKIDGHYIETYRCAGPNSGYRTLLPTSLTNNINNAGSSQTMHVRGHFTNPRSPDPNSFLLEPIRPTNNGRCSTFSPQPPPCSSQPTTSPGLEQGHHLLHLSPSKVKTNVGTDDVESSDSGRGCSSSDNCTGNLLGDPLKSVGRENNKLIAFPVTDSWYDAKDGGLLAWNPESHCPMQSTLDRKKCNTLPFTDDPPLVSPTLDQPPHLNAKSSTDLRCPTTASTSVQRDTECCNRHPVESSCQYQGHPMADTDRSVLLITPVDQLGYAQLLHHRHHQQNRSDTSCKDQQPRDDRREGGGDSDERETKFANFSTSFV